MTAREAEPDKAAPEKQAGAGKGTAASPARREAFTILMAVARHESHSDDLLRGKRVSVLSPQDRHLCTALVLGVLRWQLYLDARIRPLLTKPNARLDEAVSIALRLGAFQLWFLDRIPTHAAISESVALTKKAGHRFASGLVNAVLRKAAALEKETDPDTRTAYPHWMVERWTSFYGEEAARAICRQGQTVPETALRLVTEEVEAALVGEGVTCAPGLLMQAARRVNAGDVIATEAFRNGRARIQEEGSQLIAELSTSRDFSPRSILDCCAAPGGKTLILAELNGDAHVTACEISAPRFHALQQRIAAVTNISMNTPGEQKSRIELILGDITQLELKNRYDFVLADVPCSGTGTLGRNPEIRHRLTIDDLAHQHKRQCAILHAALEAASTQRARVVYSTCSLEPEENEHVISEVLAQAQGWRRISLSAILSALHEEGRINAKGFALLQPRVSADGALLLLPGSLGEEHATDGFFMAMLERTPV